MPRKELNFIMRLSYEEKEKLEKSAEACGYSMAEYVRSLINGLEPREKPSDEFYDILKEMRRIGVNLNQLARHVNTFGYASNRDFRELYDEVSKLILDMKNEYLYPKKLE